MNNLNLPQVASNQNQKEVTINDQAMALDAAFSEVLPIDMSESDVSLSQEDFTRNVLFNCSGNNVARTLSIWPSKRLFLVANGGTADILISAGGTLIVTVPAGNTTILHCDGTNVRVASSGANSGLPDAPADGKAYSRKNNTWVDSGLGDIALALDTINGEKI